MKYRRYTLYGPTVFCRYNFGKAPPERPPGPSPSPRPFDAAALERFRQGQAKQLQQRKGALSTMLTSGLGMVETKKNTLLGE